MRHKLTICILLLTLVPNKAWPQPRKVVIPDQGTVIFGGMAPIPVDNRSSEEKRYEAAIISAAHHFAHQGYIDYLLAIPTMLAATAYSLWKAREGLEAEGLGQIGVGFATAFIVAFFTVRWVLAVIGRIGFTPFGWYRIALGSVMLAFLVLR